MKKRILFFCSVCRMDLIQRLRHMVFLDIQDELDSSVPCPITFVIHVTACVWWLMDLSKSHSLSFFVSFCHVIHLFIFFHFVDELFWMRNVFVFYERFVCLEVQKWVCVTKFVQVQLTRNFVLSFR
jgi:hypothetical protein